MFAMLRDDVGECLSTVLCTRRRLPMKVWFMTIAFFTIATTALMLFCVCTEQWEVTTYNYHHLLNTTASKADALSQCAYTDMIPVGEYGWALITYSHASASTVSAAGRCDGVGQVQNISLVFPQHGSAFRLCLDVDDELWPNITALCKPQAFDRCLVYDAESVKQPFCCVRCLYSVDEVEDMDVQGATSFEPIFTVIGFVIVSLIILSVCHILAIIAFWKRIVPVVLITGILFLVSGTFMAFCLAAHQYKVEIMNRRRRTLPHMTPEMISSSTTVAGWSVDVGWMGFAISILTGILWIRFSYYLASETSASNKVRPTFTILHANSVTAIRPKSPKPLASPIATALPKVVRWAANSVGKPLSRETSSAAIPDSRRNSVVIPDNRRNSAVNLLPDESSPPVTTLGVNGGLAVQPQGKNKHPMMVEESV